MIRRYRCLCSMKHTGLGSRIAEISSPLASSAVDGATTLIPGACMNHDSGFCEWNGPPEKPPPEGRRTVMFTESPMR